MIMSGVELVFTPDFEEQLLEQVRARMPGAVLATAEARWMSQSSYPPTYSSMRPSPSNTSVLVTTLLRKRRS